MDFWQLSREFFFSFAIDIHIINDYTTHTLTREKSGMSNFTFVYAAKDAIWSSRAHPTIDSLAYVMVEGLDSGTCPVYPNKTLEPRFDGENAMFINGFSRVALFQNGIHLNAEQKKEFAEAFKRHLQERSARLAAEECHKLVISKCAHFAERPGFIVEVMGELRVMMSDDEWKSFVTSFT